MQQAIVCVEFDILPCPMYTAIRACSYDWWSTSRASGGTFFPR